MAIGERIRQARHMNYMSMRGLAEKAGISHNAISKYENNEMVPSSRVLIVLSRILNVRIEFLLRAPEISKIEPLFRKQHKFSKTEEMALMARVRDKLERYMQIERFRPSTAYGFSLPKGFPRSVRTWDDVEKAAEDLREAWNLGLDPIENLTELFEDNGIRVDSVDVDGSFDACTFQAEVAGEMHFIFVRSSLPGDRQRFSLAHELAHFVLHHTEQSHMKEEKMAQRFAAAFLVPCASVRSELGPKRHTLSLQELYFLKRKYGMSMSAWICRARDLGILSVTAAEHLFKLFKSREYHKKEPGDPLPSEKSSRFERLVFQALAEDMISAGRAAELFGKSLAQFLSESKSEWGEAPLGTCD